MKKLLLAFVVFYSSIVLAKQPNIVAVVNDSPITKYDFQDRKKLLIVFNNVDSSDANIVKKLDESVLEGLIIQELLFQHADEKEIEVVKEQIEGAISSIEKSNGMPAGHLIAFMQENGISVSSFRNQIKAEIIKQQIFGSLSASVDISPSEIDFASMHNKTFNFNIEAWIFTSKEEQTACKKSMNKLRSRLKKCADVKESTYKHYADAKKINTSLKSLSDRTKSVITDTNEDEVSYVYKEDGKFKIALVCKKDIQGDKSEDQVKGFLSNKKSSLEAMKFMKELRSRAFIKKY